MTEKKCPICGGGPCARLEAVTDALSGKEYFFMRCAACAAQFADPMENPGPAWYARAAFYNEDACRSGAAAGQRAAVFKRLALPAGTKILDVGCGAGEFLGLIAAAGWRNCAGIDFSPEQVKLAREISGLAEISVSSLDDYLPGRAGTYGFVSAFEVLEHQSDPSGFIAKLKTLLVPGGLLMLSMPNARRPFIFGGRESWDYPPHHLTRWDAALLDRFLTARGFTKVVLEDSRLTEEHVYNQLFGMRLDAGVKRFIALAKELIFGQGRGAGAKPMDALVADAGTAGAGKWLRLRRLRRLPAASVKMAARVLLFPLSCALLGYYLARGHRGVSLVAAYRLKEPAAI